MNKVDSMEISSQKKNCSLVLDIKWCHEMVWPFSHFTLTGKEYSITYWCIKSINLYLNHTNIAHQPIQRKNIEQASVPVYCHWLPYEYPVRVIASHLHVYMFQSYGLELVSVEFSIDIITVPPKSRVPHKLFISSSLSTCIYLYYERIITFV